CFYENEKQNKSRQFHAEGNFFDLKITFNFVLDANLKSSINIQQLHLVIFPPLCWNMRYGYRKAFSKPGWSRPRKSRRDRTSFPTWPNSYAGAAPGTQCRSTGMANTSQNSAGRWSNYPTTRRLEHDGCRRAPG